MSTTKNPKKPILISTAPYPGGCHYVATPKALKAVYKHYKYPDRPQGYEDFFEGKQGAVNVVEGNSSRTIVFIRPLEPYRAADIASCAAHEAVHIWQFMKEYIGENAPGWEPEAYFIDYITKHIVEAYLDTLEYHDEKPFVDMDSERTIPGSEETAGAKHSSQLDSTPEDEGDQGEGTRDSPAIRSRSKSIR